ncbi:tyrosine-type recombinase/integrase [Fibrivirga algicola]|uniref:Tyrosine-type recombinase/integrase n=1 Tax=Fibrivirga algicola TaxID=2950420 RepID=A0ABX0QBR3_9BACT|nr:tyrosine-type recombinase/integrase [Fibrivirga algicola]NID09338.1 tyrosine-type recombinase/integrase [Fibrivirga algicola]
MSATVDRYLRNDQPDKAGRFAIMLAVYWSGNRVRLSSGEKALPAEWDDEKKQVRTRVKFSSDINQRLSTYASGLNSFVYQQENAGVVVTEDMVRAEKERIRVELLGKAKPTAAPSPIVSPYPSIDAFGLQFRAEMKAQKSKAWDTTTETVLKHLKAYRPDLDWPDLDIGVLNLFKVYLQDELSLADTTMKAYVAMLRGLLKYAAQKRMPVPPDFTWLESRSASDPILPELNWHDLNQLRDVTIRDKQLTHSSAVPLRVYEDTRWYFAMAASTGLRHSDLWQLQTPKLMQIDGIDCLDAVQQKTGKRVPIPLNDYALGFLESRPSGPPPDLYNYNYCLKDVGKQAGWLRPVVLGSFYKGRMVAETMELYKAANSHMARRTFATLMSNGGMPTRTLQEIMGHVAISSTGKYVKVSSSTVVSQTMDAWKRGTNASTSETRGVDSASSPGETPTIPN